MKEFWTSLASLLGVLAFCQSLLQAVFPPELRFAALKFFARVSSCFSAYCYFDITEIDGVNTNELYNAVQLYLSSFISACGSRLSLTRAINSSATTFGLSNNDSIADVYNGVTVQWEHVVTQRQLQSFSWWPLPNEKRGFTLRIRKKDKDLVLDSYLDHIMEKANEIWRKNQERLLYTTLGAGRLIRGANLGNRSRSSTQARSTPWRWTLRRRGRSWMIFRTLRSEELGMDWGELRKVAEKARMTQADVSEVLIKNRRDRAKAVRELIEATQGRVGKYSDGARECSQEMDRGAAEKEGEEQEKRALDSPMPWRKVTPGEGSLVARRTALFGDDREEEVMFWILFFVFLVFRFHLAL